MKSDQTAHAAAMGRLEAFNGRWETARDGSAWELDFRLSYAKTG